MRILFAGTPEVAVPTLEALVASPHEIVGVLTRADAPAGRGKRLTPSPVKVRAEELGLEVLTGRPRDAQTLARLRELAPQAVAVVAYGEILRGEALDIPPLGWINLHFSILPAWRGAAPVQRAIMAGDELTGASTFIIGEGIDTGPVFGTLTETVRPRDTAGELLGRLAHAGAPLMVATMDALAEGRLVPEVQSADGVSHAAKIDVAEARVDWALPALAIDRRIRGCTPEPGAWTTLPGGARLGLGPVTLDPGVADLPAGVLRITKREVHVGTATHAVRLGEVQPVGKKPMAAADWARGARGADGPALADGTILGAA